MMEALYRSDWLKYAILLYIDILYICAIWHIILMKFGPWSVIHVFGAVYGLINFSTSALTISDDVACLSGTEYLVSKSYIMSIYECPLSVIGSGPTISIDILSNAVSDVSVRIIGCRVLGRWAFSVDNSCIYFYISNFIPDQK